MIDAFQNDHQSMQIGQLIIENQTDKVIIYGDIDIYKTDDGLAQAKQLQQLFNNIVDVLSQQSELENQQSSAKNDMDSVGVDKGDNNNKDKDNISDTVKVVKNPFAK